MAFVAYKVATVGDDSSGHLDTAIRSVGNVFTQYYKLHPDESIEIDVNLFGKGIPIQSYDFINVHIYNTNCNKRKSCDIQSKELADLINANYYDPKGIGEIYTAFYGKGLPTLLGIDAVKKTWYLKPELKDYHSR